MPEKIEKKKDIMDRMVSKLNSIRPRKKEAGFFEVCRSNKEVLSKINYVLPLGIDSFDSVTGGLPFGRITEIYGLDACGKTAMAIRAAVRAQKKLIYEKMEDGSMKLIDKKSKVIVLYVDNEQSLDDGEKLMVDGVELDCIISRCDTIDQMFKMLDCAIDEISKEENEADKPFLVVIIDTIAATSSHEEMTGAWGKEDYARQPKQLREGFRTLMRQISRHNVCVICTNQVSDNFKAAKGGYRPSNLPQDSDFTAFGGKALRYYARLRVFVYLVREKYRLRKGALTSSGFVAGFYTRKNAQNWPSRDGRMVLIYGKGWDDNYSMLEQFILYKFAESTEDGEIEFFFNRNGVPTTTFGEKTTTLEEDDDNEGDKGDKKKKGKRSDSNPFIESRGHWPAFYNEHKADFDALAEKLRSLLFTDEAEERIGEVVPDDADDAETALAE